MEGGSQPRIDPVNFWCGADKRWHGSLCNRLFFDNQLYVEGQYLWRSTKGDCWALAKVYTLLSALLVIQQVVLQEVEPMCHLHTKNGLLPHIGSKVHICCMNKHLLSKLFLWPSNLCCTQSLKRQIPPQRHFTYNYNLWLHNYTDHSGTQGVDGSERHDPVQFVPLQSVEYIAVWPDVRTAHISSDLCTTQSSHGILKYRMGV